MIDLHCHLLPGLDDGPATWEETLALGRQLVSEGVTHVAATPHSYSQGGKDIQRVTEGVAAANRLFQQKALPLRVLPGMEVILTELTVPLLRKRLLLPLGNSSTILLETSAYAEFEELEEPVDRIQKAGYRILLAHPEKIETLYDYPNMLVALVKRGVSTQITAASLAGLNGKRKQDLCEKLLLHGLAHVIGSDAHAAEGSRRPAMREGLAVAQDLLGAQAAYLFTTIPRMILEDRELPDFDPREI